MLSHILLRFTTQKHLVFVDGKGIWRVFAGFQGGVGFHWGGGGGGGSKGLWGGILGPIGYRPFCCRLVANAIGSIQRPELSASG